MSLVSLIPLKAKQRQNTSMHKCVHVIWDIMWHDIVSSDMYRHIREKYI